MISPRLSTCTIQSLRIELTVLEESLASLCDWPGSMLELVNKLL